ncbi:MAG: hypothetical protein V1870_03730 [Candidatus Aenigmatarchaeota archaeon]
MTFFSKREKSYDENEIRKAVDSDGLSMSSEAIPSKSPVPQERQMNRYERLDMPTEAPLFIKVEKYKEIAASVNEMRHFISGIKQIFLVMNEIQEVQQNSVNILRVSVQRLEKSMEWVDKAMLKPAGFEDLPVVEGESRQIEQSLMDLQREISGLKRDLEKLG